MFELTPDQRAAVAGGDTRAKDTVTKATYVLVPESVFERLWNALGDDSPPMTAEALDAVMADDDANDPSLDYYQKKYGNP